MKKFCVNKLYHRREVEQLNGEPVFDTKLIGYFSSYKNAKSVLEGYKFLPGFKDWPEDFVIEKVLTSARSVNCIYELTHFFEDKNGYDIVTNIAVCLSKNKAKKSVVWLKTKPEFSHHPEGFLIVRYELDKSFWKEGFKEWTSL